MNCADRAHKVREYLKGRLTPAEADEFARHLERCGECRQEVERERRLDSLLFAWDDPDPVPWFLARVLARAAGPAPARSSGFKFRLPVLSAAAAGVLVLAGLTWWVQGQRSRQAPEVLVAGQYEFLEHLDMLEHWDMLQHWDEIEALDRTTGKEL